MIPLLTRSAPARAAPAFLSGAALLGVCLLSHCGPIPPFVAHEGRTAELTRSWPPEAQAGANYQMWRYMWRNIPGGRDEWYFNGGLFTGQRLGRFAFEEGLLGYGFHSWSVGLEGGFGLTHPSIALRGSYYPLGFDPYARFGSGISFSPLHGWWQASLLGGFRIRPARLGISAGGIASSWGLGPTLVLEYRLGKLALRNQSSITFKSPWAPSAVAGRIVTVGLAASYISR